MMLDELQGLDQMQVANCIFGKERRFVPYIYLGGKNLGSFAELYDLHQKKEVRKVAGLIEPTD